MLRTRCLYLHTHTTHPEPSLSIQNPQQQQEMLPRKTLAGQQSHSSMRLEVQLSSWNSPGPPKLALPKPLLIALHPFKLSPCTHSTPSWGRLGKVCHHYGLWKDISVKATPSFRGSGSHTIQIAVTSLHCTPWHKLPRVTIGA